MEVEIGHRSGAAGRGLPSTLRFIFFSCDCLMASMARSVDCLIQNILDTVQVHLIGAEPIVQVKQ